MSYFSKNGANPRSILSPTNGNSRKPDSGIIFFFGFSSPLAFNC